MTTRRAILIGAGSIAIAGCSNRTSETTVTDEYRVGVDQPEEFIEYSVEVVQGEYSNSNSPVTIELTMTNISDSELQYYDQRDAVFYMNTDSGYGLYSDELSQDVYTYDEDESMWVLESPVERTADVQFESLESGESRTVRLLLLAQPRDADHSPSWIEFDTMYEITDEDTEVNTSNEIVDVAIPFTIEATLYLTLEDED